MKELPEPKLLPQTLVVLYGNGTELYVPYLSKQQTEDFLADQEDVKDYYVTSIFHSDWNI